MTIRHAGYWNDVEFYVAPTGWRVKFKNNNTIPLTGWMKQKWTRCEYAGGGSDDDPVFGASRIVPVDGSEGFWVVLWGDEDCTDFDRLLAPGEESTETVADNGLA